MNNKTTKRALVSSVVALLICFTMLIGTTYAWFTDVVTSSNNIIKTGILDAVVTWTDKPGSAEDTWKDVQTDSTPVFDYKLWEPGYVAVRQLKVANNGTLAFKYKLQIIAKGTISDENGVRLSDVIDVYYAPSKVDVPNRDLENNPNLEYVGTLSEFVLGEVSVNGVLLAGESNSVDYATIVLKMQESAGNEYQNLSVGTSFDIMLFATQYTYEEDSFDNQYDAGADFPAFGSDSANANNPDDYEAKPDGWRIRFDIMNQSNGGTSKLATAYVWPESIADSDEDVQITVKQTDTLSSSSITLDDGQTTQNYEITATNIKEGNTKPINVTLRIGTNKNFVALYHKDTLIEASYDHIEGNLVFETTNSSPFTVVLADEPVDEFPGLPDATIENITNQQPAEGFTYGYAGTNYQGLTLVDPGKIDSVYKITANETPEEAEANKYADWKCDFFVKVDKDIAANSIILAGQYEEFLSDWIAFSNPVDIEGETYIPLLLLVSNGWTYEEIVKGVGTFNCGVKDADGSLAANDVTFTVQLRLVNPEAQDLQNPADGEYIVIDEVSYNFATGTSTK